MNSREKPDLSNKEQREKIWNAYLKKTKTFWYWLNKFSLYVTGIGGASTLFCFFNNAYSTYLGIAFLILVIGIVGVMITRYKLDGSLLKPWWEIY